MEGEDEAQRRLLAIFRAEAEERLRSLSGGLLELEQGGAAGERARLFERLLREAHSLKGASRSVGLLPVEGVARVMERALVALREQTVAPSPPLFDALHRAVDAAGVLVAASPAVGADTVAPLRDATRALEQQLPGSETAAAPAPPPAPAPAAEMPPAPETVRLPAARLGTLLLETEQLLSSRLAEEHFVAELRAALRGIDEWRKEISGPRGRTRPRVDTAERLKELAARLAALESAAAGNLRSLGSSVNALLSDLKDVLMLPAATLLGLVPRMVRDLARAQGKEIDVVIEGGEFEIDKRVLDEIKDAVIHLVRNAVDHGIEPPAAREERGKTRRGRITLRVEQREAGRVDLEVSDDGAGMDAERIRAAAVERGMIEPHAAAALDEREARQLAFRSGVTTHPAVTDISGRGLGLAIVQEKVTALNGSLRFDSTPGAGTRFRIQLPLTLATFRGVVVGSAGRLFVFPSANVDQVVRAAPDEVRNVENRPTLSWAGQVLPVVRLSELLGLGEQPHEPRGKIPAVLASAGGRRMAFAVDAVLNEQEVLVKPLGGPLVRIRNVASAALLGSGAVVPILHVPDLLASAVRAGAGAAAAAVAAVREPALQPRSLLVVEDSITTRTLLRTILEGAGYTVQTAVDGLDALTRLREHPFDLVVSDVAMPRMDGVELTAAVRADPRLAVMPVVLVSALEAPRDRERGIAAGANAYIVKSSFDQGNLLAAIERLLAARKER